MNEKSLQSRLDLLQNKRFNVSEDQLRARWNALKEGGREIDASTPSPCVYTNGDPLGLKAIKPTVVLSEGDEVDALLMEMSTEVALDSRKTSSASLLSSTSEKKIDRHVSSRVDSPSESIDHEGEVERIIQMAKELSELERKSGDLHEASCKEDEGTRSGVVTTSSDSEEEEEEDDNDDEED